MFTAFLDANVLVPIQLCDTLLRCAQVDLYRPVWSAKVVQEACEAIHRIHPNLSESRITSRFSNMNAAFPLRSTSSAACRARARPMVAAVVLIASTAS